MFADTKRAPFTGCDIRFTTKGDVLYATLLAWPGTEARIESLGANLRLYNDEIASVQLLGCDTPIQWSRDEGGLKVQLPAHKPCEHAYVLKITSKK